MDEDADGMRATLRKEGRVGRGRIKDREGKLDGLRWR